MSMNKPEGWDKFLNYMGDSFLTTRKDKEIFLVKFRYENTNKKEGELSQLADETLLNFKKRMTGIYRQFTDSPQGCPDLIKFKQKFDKLRSWLREEKYPQWIQTYLLNTSYVSYVERREEYDCYEQVLHPKSFIRIKASSKIGKTLLMSRVLDQLKDRGYQTIRFDFGLQEKEMFFDYRAFSKSFCAGITEALDLPERISEYWSDNLGINQNITKYFQKYILPEIKHPLILGLDDLDCVFEQEHIATNFCKLLRSWHDNHRENWQKLRLIVAHSTDVYSGLAINSSPLAGIGQVIVLTLFSRDQVQTLAQRYQLDLEQNQIYELMLLLGGHPYLIQKAFKYLKSFQIDIDVSWENFLQLTATDESPFINHLRDLLATLKQNSELATAFAEIILVNEPIPLRSDIGLKLQGLALVTVDGNLYSPSCDLYRQYFLAHINELRQ